MPPRAQLKMSDDEIRESRSSRTQLKLQQRARHRPHDLLAARLRHGPPHRRRERVSLEWSQICNDLIARVVALYPEELHRRLPAAAVARRDAEASRSASSSAACKSGLRRLQPQSRSVRRLFQRAAADRQVVVSGLREDDRARRAGDDPRHRAAAIRRMHTTGSYYLNADTMAFMQLILSDLFKRFPEAQVHHPARRRRGRRSTGAASAASRSTTSKPRARRDHGQQHLLRHLRLSSAGHRPAHQGGAGRQHPVRLEMVGAVKGNDPRSRLRASTTPSVMSTRPPLSDGDKARDLRRQRLQGLWPAEGARSPSRRPSRPASLAKRPPPVAGEGRAA